MEPSEKPRPMGWVLIVALIGHACLSASAFGYSSGCYDISSVGIEVDCSNGVATFSAACVEQIAFDCPKMSSARLRAGVDSNGNGALDDDEVDHEVNDPQTNGKACFGVGSIHLPPDAAGKSLIVEIVRPG